MKKVYYYKLVRDRIPKKIEANGGTHKMRTLGSKEFERELLLKAGEEAGALAGAKDRAEVISELADVIAVLEEIKKLKKISKRELARALRANFARKGGFKKRLYLVWSSDTGYRTNERRYRKPKKK